MADISIFDNGTHRNILLEEYGSGLAVQANQHFISHGDEGMILDPGGHKVYNRVLSETLNLLGRAKLKYVFLSHQDPDIVAATNGWLLSTDAQAYISQLWLRFVPHFGLDSLVESRLKPIPDEGTTLDLGGAPLRILPAHFLHSPGNFHVYDPTSRVLYSGDLGASLGIQYRAVTDFDAHVPAMEGFHRRYMGGNRVMRAWAEMVRSLDIEVVAPQHGAYFPTRDLSRRFIDWCADLQCGPDLVSVPYRAPA